MPYAVITTNQSLNNDQRHRLHHETTRLLADVLGKNAALTSVRIEETPAALWSVGGRHRPAAHLDVKVTEGTNLTAQKRRFLAAAHDMLLDVLGDLPVATYVVIDEVPGLNWGYSGLSQTDRKKAAKRPPAYA